MMLPDFLGIGAQKAGSTWLYANLRCHPELFLPETKELHYFDKIDDARAGLKTYSDFFLGGGEKIKGEITPAYGILPKERIRFIREIMPRARLIFIMRNPIERAWSHAKMDLLQKRRKKFDEVRVQDFLDHFKNHASLSRGDYEEILDNWSAEFSPGQIFVGFFEDISTRPHSLLEEICAHIGVSGKVPWNDDLVINRIHEGADQSIPRVLQDNLHEIYHEKIRRLGLRFKEVKESWLV